MCYKSSDQDFKHEGEDFISRQYLGLTLKGVGLALPKPLLIINNRRAMRNDPRGNPAKSQKVDSSQTKKLWIMSGELS